MDKSSRPYAPICTAIDDYFRKNEISYVKAAKALNVSPAAVSLQLSGNKPFGKNAAEKWHHVFHFSKDFLLFGTGYLFDDNEEFRITNNSEALEETKWKKEREVSTDHPFYRPNGSFVRNIIAIIASSDNVFLCSAFDKLYEKGNQAEAELSNLLRLAREKTRCDELAHVILAEEMGIKDNFTTLNTSRKTIEDLKREYSESREKLILEMVGMLSHAEEPFAD